VKFDPPVVMAGKAENYLLALLKAQIYTLSQYLATSMSRYPQEVRINWVTAKDSKSGATIDPAQIILLVSAIDFVQQVEKSMSQSAAGDARSLIKCQDLVKAQLADLIGLTQTNLSKGDRQRVMCMITLDAHDRDIIDILLKEKALLVTDFQWQSKLRPMFVGNVGKNENIVSTARFGICDAGFDYGFEYLGKLLVIMFAYKTGLFYILFLQAMDHDLWSLH
jgi:dynein heavy chain, axonemal